MVTERQPDTSTEPLPLLQPFICQFSSEATICICSSSFLDVYSCHASSIQHYFVCLDDGIRQIGLCSPCTEGMWHNIDNQLAGNIFRKQQLMNVIIIKKRLCLSRKGAIRVKDYCRMNGEILRPVFVWQRLHYFPNKRWNEESVFSRVPHSGHIRQCKSDWCCM